MSPNFTEPYTHSADFAVEQQLARNTTFTVGWVGTRGMRLPYSIDLNQPAYTGATRTYDVSTAAGATLSTVTVPFYPAVAASGKPSPNDGNFSVAYSGLNTWYNALSFSLKQQNFYGFTTLFNYTWAHTEDAGQVSGTNGTFFGTDVILDPFNRKENYSNPAINMTREQARSDLDMRGRFVGSVVYTTRFAIANRFAGYGANGWTLGGTATEQTGFPVTAQMSNNPGGAYTNTAGAVVYPGTAVYTTGTGATAVASGQDGSATGGADNTNNAPGSSYGRAPQVKRNLFAGPGVHNLDVRISRDFRIHEGYTFQILGEAFNVVNHRNGLAVATTAYSFAAPGSSPSCPVASHVNTCIIPYVSTTPFGTINSTSSTLYGARQLQFAAKLFF
jgi:hypothetical protein